MTRASLCSGSGEASPMRAQGFVEQKLVLLDVGFAGVSPVWMTSKVGLITVSKLWMARRPCGPLCSGVACWGVGSEEVLGEVESVLRQVDATVTKTTWVESWRE